MTPSVREFVKVLGGIDRSKSRADVFRDFCELAYCATAKAACPFDDQRDALEAQYMEVVRRYRNKDDVRKMPELLAIALHEITTGGGDFMGEVAGELGTLNADMGQFFTPYEVSRVMAEMNLSGAKEIIEREGFITISEPAAGAGGMLVAVADTIEGMGFDPARHIWVEAVELNHATFHMCYLQVSGRGIAGKVTCGNSLSNETFTQAYTAAASQFYSINGDPFAKQRAQAEAKAKAEAARDARLEAERAERRANLTKTKPTTDAVQTDLFG